MFYSFFHVQPSTFIQIQSCHLLVAAQCYAMVEGWVQINRLIFGVGLCDKWNESIEALVGVPSVLRVSQEVQTIPLPPPWETVHWGIDTRELEERLLRLTVTTQTGGEVAGKEESGRSVVEAGMGEIKGERDQIRGGWELIWVEDP